jgi:cell shape-determining protein MreD
MRRSPIFWVLAVLLPVLHFLLYVGLGIGIWAPDLLTVALLLLAREVRTSTAAAIGFFFGLLEDAFSILAFGANTLTMTLLGILGSRSRDLFLGESVVFFLSYLAVGTWLRFAIHWALAGEEVRGPAGRVLLLQGPVAALYAAGVGVLFLLLTGTVRAGVVD